MRIAERKGGEKMEDETGKMVTELLEKQLQLLSEQSRDANGWTLVKLSEAMVEIARFLIYP